MLYYILQDVIYIQLANVLILGVLKLIPTSDRTLIGYATHREGAGRGAEHNYARAS